MSECPSPPPVAVTDAQMHVFYGDADAMLSAQTQLDTAMADLAQAPFDAAAQRALATCLSSSQLERATAAARRLGEGL